MMKNIKDIIKILVVGATLFYNFFLIYGLLYQPYNQIRADDSQPYHVPDANLFIIITTFVIICLLLLSSLFLLLNSTRGCEIYPGQFVPCKE